MSCCNLGPIDLQVAGVDDPQTGRQHQEGEAAQVFETGVSASSLRPTSGNVNSGV
jgi:hypothetical protein